MEENRAETKGGGVGGGGGYERAGHDGLQLVRREKVIFNLSQFHQPNPHRIPHNIYSAVNETDYTCDLIRTLLSIAKWSWM